MKKETQTEKYREPKGFKGTKGALLQPKYNKGIVEIDNGKDTYWFAETYAPGIGEPSIKYANAKLISQSKEIAKALQDVTALLGWLHTELTPEGKQKLINAKQVLKEAGLTE